MAKNAFPKLIGVIHLPPLGDAPQGDPNFSLADRLEYAGHWAINEALLLQKSGFDGLIVENFGDAPFFKSQVPPETLASMAVIAAALKEVCKVPLGVNVLRNDARSALAIASVTGAEWMRVNVLSGVAATDQGFIEGDAAELLRKKRIVAPELKIFADVHVKHAKTLSQDSLVMGIEEVTQRGMADAVIVTGATTGRAVSLSDLEAAFRATRALKVPLYVGSGMNPENLEDFMPLCDGVIVGSALRKGKKAGAKLDSAQVKKFVKAFRRSMKR